MAKIAVMGDYDSIYAFAALGLTIFPADDPAEARKTLRRLADSDYGVIYVTEELAADPEFAEEMSRYEEELSPALILIPGVKGNTGNGVAGVKKSVEKAVGSDILFG